MRVAVIGTGFGKHAAAPAYESQGFDVEIVNPRDDSAVQKAIASDVDLVSVHSPPFMHVDHVSAAIEHGHAVLCDKPFGRDTAEAEDPGVAGAIAHRLRLVSIAAERLVAQHRMSMVDRGRHMAEMHERW